MSAILVRPTWAARRARVEARDVRPDVRPRCHGAAVKPTLTRGNVFGPHGPSVGPHERYGRGVVTPRPVVSLGDGPGGTSSYARIGLKHDATVGDSCNGPIDAMTYQRGRARLVLWGEPM